MTRLSYTKAIDGVLNPLGFQREKSIWTRIRDDMEEKLDLQKSWIDGSVTVNVWAKDLETDRILKSIPCNQTMGIIQFGVRIGKLIDGPNGLDRWWKNNPNGPTELADLVRAFAVPWFDRVKTPEDQADKWYGRGTKYPWGSPNAPALAVTLYRLGALDEALAIFEAPVPRTAIPSLVERCRCVQRWLEAQQRKT